MMKTRLRKTLLQCLMTERHLTREHVIEVLDRRARDMGVRDFALSVRQLDRWLAGELATLPRASLCRVVEAEFGYPVQQLLALGGDLVETSSTPSGQAKPLNRLVSQAATESARFGQWADSLAIGDLAIETLHLRIRQLATAYVHTPMIPIFQGLTTLRDELFEFLNTPDPSQARDLYLVAGITCGLLAHASGNLGDLPAAHLQACTAMICARQADHPTLAAWVLTVRALQSEWSGQPEASLDYVSRARRHTARELRPSTVGTWGHAIEARALARLGRASDATHAIRQAADCRDSCHEADCRNEFDEIGGILTFPEPKRLFYAASAYRRAGNIPAAIEHAQSAISAYTNGPAEDRSYGDEALARVDLAISHASGETPDLAATGEALRPVTTLPAPLRLPTLGGPLRDLRARLCQPQLAGASETAGLLTDVGTILCGCQQPPLMVEA
jgi:hypothetical protein